MMFPTTLVGSFPQPDWLIDRQRLGVPRVRAADLWRVGDEWLAEAQDDATRLAVADQLACGIDVVTDGEIRRESYSNRFATALDGIDLEHPGTTTGRGSGPRTTVVPRVSGPIRRVRPVEVDDVRFLRSLTDHPIKITVPGPFTMSQQAENDFYGDESEVALAYARAVNEEVKDLFAAGADVVQLDEPWMEARPDKARAFGVTAVQEALRGVEGTTALHLCFGYAALVHERPNAYRFLVELADTPVNQISIETAQSHLDLGVLPELTGKDIMVGVLDLSRNDVEPPDVVQARAERALQYLAPERVILAPDCGMKFLPRESAEGKLRSMVRAAEALRVRYER
jgi:5-methyltetrahydropteroyltriglutamate--homocysteine methyltransferase